MANYGFFLLLLCCILSSYGFLGSVGAAGFRHRRLWRSARMASTASLILALTASAFMIFALFTRDFSIQYVYKNSSLDLPPIYTFTAFWSSLEGSHMLWTLFLNICTVICLWTYAKDNEHIMPYVSATLQLVLAWMFYLAVTHSDLFAFMPFPQTDGRGMNNLLQNPYMAIHPPMLFTGYTCMAVPFAYSIAALCYGDITEGWLKTVRRWALVAWCFLTGAIILGGRWAYVELGWAGYWAWDPVENSSLLPWLFATALLHSLLIQGQLGHLKRMSFVLSILGFFMTFFGTFITRSGVITSVHSFAESPIGPNYLMFLAALLFISAAIYGFRAHLVLPPDTDKVWGVSKESALVVTLLIVLSFAAIVFVGTIFPIVSEALTKRRISIQAPYFNAFAPYFGLATILAISFGNLMRYQTKRIPHGPLLMGVAALVALPLSGILIYFGGVLQTVSTFGLVAQIVGMYLSAWAMACLTGDLYFRLKDIRWEWRLFFKRNLAYFGAYVAHIGMLVMILGFLGNYRGLEQEISLGVNETKSVFGYNFTLQSSIQVKQEKNVTLYEAPIEVKRGDQTVGVMNPARSKYPTSGDLLHEVAVMGNIWRDLYVVLRDFDKVQGDRVSIQINLNPTVRFVWLATFIMVIGGLIALCDPYRGDKTRDVIAGKWEASV